MTETKFCKSCGTPLSPTANFCRECGTAVPKPPSVDESIVPAPVKTLAESPVKEQATTVPTEPSVDKSAGPIDVYQALRKQRSRPASIVQPGSALSLQVPVVSSTVQKAPSVSTCAPGASPLFHPRSRTRSIVRPGSAISALAPEASSTAQEQVNEGLALYEKGDYQGALSKFETAIEADPNLSAAWNNKACTLGRLGDRDAALEAFDKALEIDPNNREAREGKDMCLRSAESS